MVGDEDRPPAWHETGSAIDRLLARVETMFELGTSALVPILTIALPMLLALVSFFVVPYEMSARLQGPRDPGDEEYVSIAPHVGYEGDVPPVEEAEPEVEPAEELPAQGDPTAPAEEGVAEPVAAEPGPEVPADVGGAPATGPVAGRGVDSHLLPGLSEEAIARAKAGGRTKKCTPEPNPRIVPIGEQRWRLDSKMVDYYATHIKALDALGWVSKWKAEDGSRKGFKVGGLSCGNDAWLAGLRNGDVVLTVNGTKVSSILEGIAAYARHRKADVIALEILRKDTIRVHTYRME